MATYYVIKDPSSMGYVRYLANTWPAANGSNGTGGVTLSAILNLSSNSTIIIDGGVSGLSYSGSELGTSGTLSSYKANLVIRPANISDPDYTSHNGGVSFISSSGAILLSTVVMTGFNFTGFVFESTAAGGGTCLFDLNITSGTFTDCSIINNYGGHSSGVVLVRGATSNVTFNNTNFSGTGNNMYILQNTGALAVNDCIMDGTRITSHAAINCSGSGSTTLLHALTITGNSGSASGNMAISAGVCSSFTISNCDISNYGATPITISASATNVLIFGNNIHNGTGYGITNNSSGAQIYNNVINNITYSSNGYGIYNNSNNSSIYENIIHDMDGSGIYNLGNTNNIYRNTIYNCWNGLARGSGGVGSAMMIAGGSSGNKIYRNYVYNNFKGIAIATSSGTGANIIYANLAYHNYVNDIDQQEDAGVNHEMIYNNTVIHSPDYVIAGNDYIGHGIAVHVRAKKSKVINNIVIVNQAASTCDALTYSSTTDVLVEVISDYNQVYSTCPNGNIGTLDFVGYTTMSTWRAALIAHGNGKIKGLGGTVDSVEAHSSDTNPLFVSDSDFHLTPQSPCIASGNDLGSEYAIDYDGISPYTYGGYGMGAFVYPGVFFSQLSKINNINGLTFSKICGVSTSNLSRLLDHI